jgi:hypothetical protein
MVLPGSAARVISPAIFSLNSSDIDTRMDGVYKILSYRDYVD